MLDIATSLASIAVRQIAACPALLAMVRQLNAKTTMAGAGSRSESGRPRCHLSSFPGRRAARPRRPGARDRWPFARWPARGVVAAGGPARAGSGMRTWRQPRQSFCGRRELARRPVASFPRQPEVGDLGYSMPTRLPPIHDLFDLPEADLLLQKPAPAGCTAASSRRPRCLKVLVSRSSHTRFPPIRRITDDGKLTSGRQSPAPHSEMLVSPLR